MYNQNNRVLVRGLGDNVETCIIIIIINFRIFILCNEYEINMYIFIMYINKKPHFHLHRQEAHQRALARSPPFPLVKVDSMETCITIFAIKFLINSQSG